MARGVRQVPSDEVGVRIGQNIRRERIRAKMTQEELASRAAVHRTAIGLLERGHRMARADTLVQLAGALSIPPGRFFAGVRWSPAEIPSTPAPGSFQFEAPGDEGDAVGHADD